MQIAIDQDKRWELYRLLGDPQRLRLLALSAHEELSIGELAELLGESQPNVSRAAAVLRRLGLLDERKQGTRVFVRLDPAARADPVVADAVRSGCALCQSDGALDRLPQVIKRRDEAAREFFAKRVAQADDTGFPAELPAYLAALAPLLPSRDLAIEIGTGDGRLLEVLAPVFLRVVAVDREQVQLARARERLARRGHENVELLEGDLGDPGWPHNVPGHGRADVAFASRVLHHAPKPAEALHRLATLVRPGGSVVVLDYLAHDDEAMREQQADLWLGFTPDELLAHAAAAGLTAAGVTQLPPAFHPAGPDAHLTWQLLAARRPEEETEIEHG